jgi:hypothetical protein
MTCLEVSRRLRSTDAHANERDCCAALLQESSLASSNLVGFVKVKVLVLASVARII